MHDIFVLLLAQTDSGLVSLIGVDVLLTAHVCTQCYHKSNSKEVVHCSLQWQCWHVHLVQMFTLKTKLFTPVISVEY